METSKISCFEIAAMIIIAPSSWCPVLLKRCEGDLSMLSGIDHTTHRVTLHTDQTFGVSQGPLGLSYYVTKGTSGHVFACRDRATQVSLCRATLTSLKYVHSHRFSGVEPPSDIARCMA
jgi:hypothetical protein